jgi:hypothetical protein
MRFNDQSVEHCKSSAQAVDTSMAGMNLGAKITHVKRGARHHELVFAPKALLNFGQYCGQ